MFGRKTRPKKQKWYTSLKMLSKALHVLADSVSSTLPLGMHLYVHTFHFLLHTLDSCLKAFSRLRNTLGLRAEQTGMPSLSPATALNPELHSIFPHMSLGDGDSVTHKTCSLVDSMHCLLFPVPLPLSLTSTSFVYHLFELPMAM